MYPPRYCPPLCIAFSNSLLKFLFCERPATASTTAVFFLVRQASKQLPSSKCDYYNVHTHDDSIDLTRIENDEDDDDQRERLQKLSPFNGTFEQ